MTTPTYEELVTTLARVNDKCDALEAELLRVRGLLQRAYLFIWSDELRKEITDALSHQNGSSGSSIIGTEFVK